ncbi:MAG: hypothetical protein GXP50_09615 [Deltaproteobacteria bacterium]|nr:hypothetical protein [Deltaproteobacteria bacterium]
MSDILSQDEIDRLLSAAADDIGDVPAADLSPAEVEAVEKAARVFFASANSALAALLARPAQVTEGLGQVVSLSDLAADKGLLVRFPFRSGFSGEMAFLLRHREASMLADLILGGEGEVKEELEEADLDALKEALTQVAGSGAPPLSATMGREVGFDPPQIQAVDEGALTDVLSWGDQAFLAVGTIKVEGILETPLRVLLPVQVAQEMAKILREEEEEGPSAGVVSAPTGPPTGAPSMPGGEQPVPPDMRNIDLILDLEVEATVRLGEAEMPLKEIQRLRPGSIIDLDKDTEAPVELVVNNQVLAKGELVVVSSDHFALRITEIESPTERIRKLGP